tara:strand:- start:15604 stop:15837 length:234 start_codon:yes stop_codon:yes gene_type:complete
MIIEFGLKEDSHIYTFGEVGHDQFFVDLDGYLCQKRDDSSFTTIADEEGEPYVIWYNNVESSEKISRILPQITKVKF